eukprot:CAMPEP_0172512858 /NCGR_PEP_ID=MMETSP1066-20121228/247710_1 /TAXON_ID=671091 /ORGANISM="Coscinodiscus wailesii, Strain CCMP2513" /LENGTH=254 /DNA_ID=CAMNT_0013292839 /DNA_START=110 /DNA_END=871 /DNA_ORIENTATION=+
MKRLHGIIPLLSLLIAATLPHETTSQNTYSPLLNFELSEGTISLNDASSTKSPSMRTIHNDKPFVVNVDLIWDELEKPYNSSNNLMWSLYIDDVYQSHDQISLVTSRTLPTILTVGTAMVTNGGGGGGVVVNHKITVKFDLDGELLYVERWYQSYHEALSLLPLLITLTLVATTRMVELSLGLGIFAGACLISGSFLLGFRRALDEFLVDAIADRRHAHVYLFVCFVAGLMGMVQKSGGWEAFSNLVTRRSRGC